MQVAETSVSLPFADGEYRFWLALPQIVALERACGDTSILEIEERMRSAIGQDDDGFVFLGGGKAMIADVRETIRLAMIGGNHALIDSEEVEIGPIRAKQLVDEYVCPARPLAEGVVIAWRILHATIFGVKLDGSKKKGRANRREPFRKGQLIVNCEALGLDWTKTDLSDYLEALEAHNEAHDPDKPKGEPGQPADPDRLRRFRKARQALN